MSLLGKWFGYDPEEVCENGLAALDRRDFVAAAEAFRVCAETSDRAATVRLARFHLAECHAQIAEGAYRRANYEIARQNIETSFAYAQPTAERHLIAARIARRLNDRSEATVQLEAALARSPEHRQARALQAVRWYEDGNTAEALAYADSMTDDGDRVRRFRDAHERHDRQEALSHLLAIASERPESRPTAAF